MKLNTIIEIPTTQLRLKLATKLVFLFQIVKKVKKSLQKVLIISSTYVIM